MSDGCICVWRIGKQREFQLFVGSVIVGLFATFLPGEVRAEESILPRTLPAAVFEGLNITSENDAAPQCATETILSGSNDIEASLSEEDRQMRALLTNMLVETPMEKMIPALLARDRKTLAFLVGIGRKESSWGQHAPSKDGVDCFNYWGMKGEGSRGVGMGYACFASPEEAVQKVGDRITTLVHEKHLDTPERMVAWKCGSSCAGHDPASVAKWISDVRLIFNQVLRS